MAEEIKVVYEDEEILILNKPAGWVTTRERVGETNKCVEDWIKDNYPSGGLPREGIVHRLDKGTSGLLVVARTQDSLSELKRQFKTREVVKKYWAVVGGEAVNGELKMPIGRHNYQFSRFGVTAEGKMAMTEFKVIKKMAIEGKKYTLLEIGLKTGRTHQIRVHMSYLGWPLLGDRLYGGEMKWMQRPFLQAKYLKLRHPGKNQMMDFEIPLAEDLEKWWQEYAEK